jgi:hypothetical protein
MRDCQSSEDKVGAVQYVQGKGIYIYPTILNSELSVCIPAFLQGRLGLHQDRIKASFDNQGLSHVSGSTTIFSHPISNTGQAIVISYLGLSQQHRL